MDCNHNLVQGSLFKEGLARNFENMQATRSGNTEFFQLLHMIKVSSLAELSTFYLYLEIEPDQLIALVRSTLKRLQMEHYIRNGQKSVSLGPFFWSVMKPLPSLILYSTIVLRGDLQSGGWLMLALISLLLSLVDLNLTVVGVNHQSSEEYQAVFPMLPSTLSSRNGQISVQFLPPVWFTDPGNLK